MTVRSGQYHLAVAGGCAAVWRLTASSQGLTGCAPTRYREVVLTRFQL